VIDTIHPRRWPGAEAARLVKVGAVIKLIEDDGWAHTWRRVEATAGVVIRPSRAG
jgi:hypothetical protein